MEPTGLSPEEGLAPSQADPNAVAVQEPPAANGEIDVAQMTPEQIGERIESDKDFAAKVANDPDFVKKMSGAVPASPAVQPDQNPAPPEPELNPPQQNMDPNVAPAQEPAPGDTPITAPDPALEPNKDAPAEENILNFQIPKADMEGYSTPGEIIKANRHANAKIDTQEQIISGQVQAISDLNSKLEAANQAPQPKPEPAPAATIEPPLDDDGEPDIYDPEYLKSIGKTAKTMKSLQEEVKTLRDDFKSQKQVKAMEKATQETFKELSDFQGLNPGFETNDPIEKVNKEYMAFIRNLGHLMGTDGSPEQNMRYVGAYLSDSSESGDQLRATAESRGVTLPADFENYSKLLQMNNARTQYQRTGPNGNPEPISLQEAKNLMYGQSENLEPAQNPELESPAPQVPVQPGAPANPNPAPPNMAAALAERDQYASTVPPGATGPDKTLDSLSTEEQSALLDTPDRELQENPQKLALVNQIYKRLGQPALNPFGQNA